MGRKKKQDRCEDFWEAFKGIGFILFQRSHREKKSFFTLSLPLSSLFPLSVSQDVNVFSLWSSDTWDFCSSCLNWPDLSALEKIAFYSGSFYLLPSILIWISVDVCLSVCLSTNRFISVTVCLSVYLRPCSHKVTSSVFFYDPITDHAVFVHINDPVSRNT